MTALQIAQQALYMNSHYETLPSDALTAPVGKAAILAAEFWPSARRETLRLAPWTCAKKRLGLFTAEWEALTAYIVGDVIIDGKNVYACTTAGTSDATEPTWSTTTTVTDGTAEWDYTYAMLADAPDENLTPYDYAFQVPADFIRQVAVTDQTHAAVEFAFEAGILYTSEEEPILIYVFDETDTTTYDPLLERAMITHLAAKLAYPLTGNHENEVALAQGAQALAQAAIVQTKREARHGPPPADSWIEGLFPERVR